MVGRIVTGGRLPLGYHGDPEKTAATFLTYEGERWLITGDLATVAEDGTVELLGRGSVSINTGGEKVHPEEVEGVLHGHPSVADVLVVGVPDERWGSAVTAVVQPAAGATPTLEELVAHCKQQLSGYKAPKHLVLVDRVVRSPAGKADYRWAADTAAAAVASADRSPHAAVATTLASRSRWSSSGSMNTSRYSKRPSAVGLLLEHRRQRHELLGGGQVQHHRGVAARREAALGDDPAPALADVDRLARDRCEHLAAGVGVGAVEVGQHHRAA